ncbi:conserved hypothetical protein [Culex quinquefasciatus]|uniref:Uncharacterized protein n=1 Tax=Culex quinquefasciatus TaxID=7176 RepID=B0WUG0_CULQU|nr:conserved hypothetical protein [Culex quinquefasciatus]|eukprot:XP_001870950.1 conserved hypothetical protein [Culex quinquefasciatus]
MNRWLTVAFLVASAGGAFSLYSAISVGSGGLSKMATNLQSLSVVMNNYYNALNTDRTVVNATLNDLAYFVNVTYAKLNKTYGITQQRNMESLMMMVSYFNQTLGYGELSVNSQIASDLNQLSYTLQQAIDSIFNSFTYTTTTMSSYDQTYVQDKCLAKNITQMVNIPNSLGKLGPCLQQEVNTANAITPIIVATIKLLKNDIIAFNNLLNICQPTSTSCIEAYFSEALNDLGIIQSSLSIVQQYVSFIQYDASRRNTVCGELVKADIQDAQQNLMSAVSSCSYPQM